eukprot:651182_1
MGQDNSKQPELSEGTNNKLIQYKESLQIWQQLMAMGFDDNIALDAVKRNGTKIGKCINYILKQNKNAPHQKTQEDTKTDDPQTYKDRIDSVLMVSESQRE